jgi:myosin heavy subunit
MNSIGRIFVVLIAILSLMLGTMMIMLYAVHTNYRMEIFREPKDVRGNETVGWKYRLNESYREQERLTQEISRLSQQFEAERTAKIQALAKAEATINRLSTENQQLSGQKTALDANLLAATNTLKATQDNLKHTTEEVDKLRVDIAAAHNDTDKQIKKATELTDRLTVATSQLELFTERNQQLVTDVSKAKRLLEKYGVTISDPEDVNTIRVAGKITNVSRDRVELSIGKDDGVREGQNLDIYRGDKYVGRVKVVESRPDMAVAAIEREFQQFPIQRGDNVASGL